jgi:cytochrome b pre-mRNA-processing protein 3
MPTIAMISRPFRRNAESRIIAALYGMIVAQARSPAFYTAYGVPDTVQGRFDLIVLHLVLLLRRFERAESARRNVGQLLFDAFCRDLDANLREMGVGDLAVPKRMRHFGEAFYGRQAAYLSAIDAASGQDIEKVALAQAEFAKALERNIFQEQGATGQPARLARYAWAVADQLAATDDGAIGRGELAFPNPEAFVDEPT